MDPAEARVYSFQRHNYKVLLSLREDFLADLEGLSDRLPSVMRNRLRLCPMNGEQALSAVTRAGGHLIEKDIAARVVRFVGAESVGGTDRPDEPRGRTGPAQCLLPGAEPYQDRAERAQDHGGASGGPPE